MALSQREKIMVTGCGVCVVIFLFLYFFLLPLMDSRSRLSTRVEQQAVHIKEMEVWQAEYRSLSTQNQSLQTMFNNRNPGFSLFSFLEMHAAQSRVKDHIVYMKPSELRGSEAVSQSQVEMKLQSIDLKRLVRFLELVESPENLVGIKRLSIQRNSKETGTLDVVMQIVSIDDLHEADS